jgi:hypothetical protein
LPGEVTKSEVKPPWAVQPLPTLPADFTGVSNRLRLT